MVKRSKHDTIMDFGKALLLLSSSFPGGTWGVVGERGRHVCAITTASGATFVSEERLDIAWAIRGAIALARAGTSNLSDLSPGAKLTRMGG